MLSRRDFLRAVGSGAVGGLAIALGGYHYCTRVEPEWLEVVDVTVPISGLRETLDGFRIAQMSDFHLHPHTRIELVREAVSLANGLSPDLTVLTGDYVLQGAESILELAPVLGGLRASLGVYASLGNHDYWTNADTVRTGLEEAGLPVLLNSGVELHADGGSIYVAGLDDGWSGRPNLARALAARSGGVPTVLLMHEPDFADTWPPQSGISLQLSGHSHGGQVRLPGIGAPVLPRFAQKYDSGPYRVRDFWVYTSRGIGVISPPVRFGCRPEITQITLVRAN